MGNSIPGTVTKILTLIPVLVAVYFSDFHNFLTIFTSPGLLAFFITTVSLFAFGVALKRKILAVRLELSRVSFAWGLPLLTLAVLLYIYGSYSAEATWYHYESFYVLIIAYVALRIGPGILRAMAPLLAILAFSFLPVVFYPDLIHRELTVFLSADLIAMFFLVFLRPRDSRAHAGSAVIPLVALSIGVIGWFASEMTFPIRSLYLDFLIPVPFVLLLVPRIRRFALLPTLRPSTTPLEHRLLPDGFCSICGLKVARARTTENFGTWGLLAVVGVAFLLILTSVPILAVVGGVPYDGHYSPGGYTGVVTPSTPSGWQVNSTNTKVVGGDLYSMEEVYVPTFHPETKNYTLYYDIAYFPPPATNASFGTDLPGWNRTLDEFMQLGPFQGHLSGYIALGKVFLTYYGTTTMVFYNVGAGYDYAVGLGFTREFHNSNITADTAQFLADVNALWLPEMSQDVSLSTWTAFLYSLELGGQSIVQPILLFSSICVLCYAAYSVSRSDERTDRFLSSASVQPDEHWSYLSNLARRPQHAGTGEELVPNAGALTPPTQSRVDSTLRELERSHLVARSIVERGDEVVSVWRAAF